MKCLTTVIKNPWFWTTIVFPIISVLTVYWVQKKYFDKEIEEKDKLIIDKEAELKQIHGEKSLMENKLKDLSNELSETKLRTNNELDNLRKKLADNANEISKLKKDNLLLKKHPLIDNKNHE